ncbi:MAG: 3'(2'),5'-bisphosphate nucleotidase CysQ [Chromatiales bacterium]|nr:3'(2'),5'-bisphosphate nucleotidase CysQ [Chromatiales bacterium]
MSLDAAALTEPLLALTRRAGTEILKIYQSDFEVDLKADDSPLTAADRASHEVLVAGLSSLAPGVPIWSEESKTLPFAERRHWERFWLLDPLDGTREFIKRNGEFTVNVALVEGGVPVLGIVHVPVTGIDYLGLQGRGAERLDPGGSRMPIRVQVPSAQPVRVVGSRSHRGSSLDAFLARLGPHEMVPMGSSLKLCLVAEGAADLYPRLGPTSEWDTAAAQAVVVAAGGQVLGLDGEPLRYNQRDTALNPSFIVFGDGSRDWAALARETTTG